MSLSQRLKQSSAVAEDAAPGGLVDPETYQRLKSNLHARVVDQLDLETASKLPEAELRGQIAGALGQLLEGGDLPLNRTERAQLVDELLDEILGIGPLEALLRDHTISDILVNTFNTVYIERQGLISRTPLRFRDNDHLMQIINRIVSRVGRRVDETSPMVDARLPDGSRVNAIIPPLAVDGPLLSIRRFGGQPLRVPDLLQIGTITPEMVAFLQAAVRAKLNILISGGTGTGKTTLLNALSAFIPAEERIVTIEDAAELQLQQPHVCRLETRPPNIEGKGEVVTRDLVRNSLRMRPDRIIVGEVRSVEVLDMLQAMNTGHEGSMATVHANSPRDALGRLMAMISMSAVNLAEAMMSQTIARALDLILQLHRSPDGKRRLISVCEVSGTEGNVIQLQEIFTFRSRGTDRQGRTHGDFVATGVRPRCVERIEQAGMELAPDLFAAGVLGESS
jgi:pilus assembly protein CpaF